MMLRLTCLLGLVLTLTTGRPAQAQTRTQSSTQARPAPAAQSAAAKEVLQDRMSADICACLTRAAPVAPAVLTKAQTKQVFTQCFAAAVGKEMRAVQAAYGQTAFNDAPLMRGIGQETGAKLIQTCPVAMTFFGAMGEKTSPEDSVPEATTTGQTVGQLGALSGAGLPRLEVLTNDSEKAYFVWLHHFDQADDLLRRLPELRGSRVRVRWREVQVLQPDTRQYQPVREITALEIL